MSYTTNMISLETIKSVKEHISKTSQGKDTDFFCVSRDIFQARLDAFIIKTNKYLESAVIGEIGNNTFDHNWQFAQNEMRGAYLNLSFENRYVILADYGQGIKESLSSVIKLANDLEAVETGFTKQISGRKPEQRGNGLKFVAETMTDKKWSMFFQTGNGCCIIEKGQISFLQSEDYYTGCLAILDFSQEVAK